MFSFFKTKKPSPSSSPESDPIPSADEFVLVDPKNPYPPANTGSGSLYPNFDQAFGGNYPPATIPTQPTSSNTENMHNVHYLHGVPFKLSSELSTGDSNEITKIQIDDILAIITSKMEVSQVDYDFGLERSLIAQEATE